MFFVFFCFVLVLKIKLAELLSSDDLTELLILRKGAKSYISTWADFEWYSWFRKYSVFSIEEYSQFIANFLIYC